MADVLRHTLLSCWDRGYHYFTNIGVGYQVIEVLIQAEAGSREKLRYNEKTHEFIDAVRMSHPYPYPYGFVVSTTAADGDNVDCYVVGDKELKSGTVVNCEIIGLLDQIESGEPDHKVLAVVAGQAAVLPDGVLDILQGFIYAVFCNYPDSAVNVGPIRSRDVAVGYVRDCLD